MYKYFKTDTLDSLLYETLDQNRPHLLLILEKLSRKRGKFVNSAIGKAD